MRTAFEHEGDVRSVDLLASLVALWREGANGSLQFSRSGATAGFEVAAGEIVASSSSDPRFETAAILVRAGKLDTRTLERLAAPEGADRALLALQAGVLTRREYRWGEKIRAVEILSDLLGWLEGEYFFFRTTEAERESAEPRLPIPRLVLELFLRSRDRSLVLKYLGGADVPLSRATHFDAEFATFGLTADAESVVRLIDGSSSAEEIASEAPAEAFAVEKLLAALVTLGLVHPAFTSGTAGAELGAAGVPEGGTRASAAPAQDEPEAEDEEPVARSEESLPEDEEDAEDDEPMEDESQDADEGEEEEIEAAEAADAPPIQNSDLDLAPSQAPVLRDEPMTEWDLGEDFGRGPVREGSPMTDVPFSGRPSLAPDLETAALAEEPRPSDLEGFDAPRTEEGGGFEQPLDTSTGVGSLERPNQRSFSPLLWVLAALVVAVGGLLWVKSRGGAPAPVSEPAAATTVTATPADVAQAAPAVVETSIPSPIASVATVAPTAPPTAVPPTPVPARMKPTARSAKPAPAPAPATEATAMPREASRQQWLDRAARDAKRLAGERKTRYAIQLELACEAASLNEAFQHDRGGSMWVLTTSFQGKTCFRVLWGRYATAEAARRALAGSPRFFSTPKNHPAVTGVR